MILSFDEEWVEMVANLLRPIDQVEVVATNPGLTVYEALERLIRICPSSYLVIAENNELVGVYGLTVTDEQGTTASPFMLLCEASVRHQIYWCRIAKYSLAVWQRRYDYLWNYVHAENLSAISWLSELGFDFGEQTIFNDCPFVKFEWWRARECAIPQLLHS
jgi:hypothetical protein